jgi:hypothetical protein
MSCYWGSKVGCSVNEYVAGQSAVRCSKGQRSVVQEMQGQDSVQVASQAMGMKMGSYFRAKGLVMPQDVDSS